MYKKHKFSIVLPHINEWYFLDITLDSIYNKIKYDNFEIIIIDDGSDRMSNLDFIYKHPLKNKIKIYFQKGLWVWGSRNFARDKVGWEFIIFLDAHMYFVNDFLWKLNNFINENLDFELGQPLVWSIQDKNIIWYIYKIKDFSLTSTWSGILDNNLKDISYQDKVESPNVAWGAMIIKKEVFEKLDWYNPYVVKWWVDLELSMRAWLRWHKSYLLPGLFVAHYFKQKFYNTQINSGDVLYNKILFAYSCFQNYNRRKKIFEKLEEYYWKKLFKERHQNVLDNSNFWKWQEEQKKNFKYSDDWYFDKFKDYYNDF